MDGRSDREVGESVEERKMEGVRFRHIRGVGFVLVMLLGALSTEAAQLESKEEQVKNRIESWDEFLKMQKYEDRIETSYEKDGNDFSIVAKENGEFLIQGNLSLFIKNIECKSFKVKVEGDVILDGSVSTKNDVHIETEGSFVFLNGISNEEKSRLFDRQKFLLGVEIGEKSGKRYLTIFPFGYKKSMTMEFSHAIESPTGSE